ncbi:MAG: lytic murein transglycosylase [Deltaproteobacteria bacterium]|nr:lytic murein transglycosylase [Deltaproteobacteria bacterium]
MKTLKKLFSTTCCVLLLLAYAEQSAARPNQVKAEIDSNFVPLITKLTEAGFDKAWLESQFKRACVTLDTQGLVLRLIVRESKINYGQFLEPSPINDTKAFLKKYSASFSRAQATYQVPAELIAAILLLETRLGTFLGQFQTLRTLASHAVGATPAVAAVVWQSLPPQEKKIWTKEAVGNALGKYSSWFFGELKAFMEYLKKTEKDPCQVFGSYTGAIGLCQFQPSNIKPYGQDGNGDGIVDLFRVEDAIMSVGFYLKQHGWRDGLSEAQKINVLKTYNNSTPYAQTLLEVARRAKP